jgi:CheY-like chemotaxis protein
VKTILVADGDNSVKNIVRLLFTEKMGYRVVAVSNGQDAILKAKEIIPDVVLADAHLSNKDGYQVAREIKSDPFLRNTHVVLLNSAFATLNKKKALKAHADGVIIKPFGAEIVERVGSLLNHNEKRGTIRFVPIHPREISKIYMAMLPTLYGRLAEWTKSTYAKSFGVIVETITQNLKGSYRLARGFAENLKVTIEKLKHIKTPTQILITKSWSIPSVEVPRRKYIAKFEILYKPPVLQKQYDYSKSFKISTEAVTKHLKDYRQAAKGFAENFKATMGKLKHIKTPNQILMAKSLSFSSLEVPRRKYLAKFEMVYKTLVSQKNYDYSKSFKIIAQAATKNLKDYSHAAKGFMGNFTAAIGKLREIKTSLQILTVGSLEPSLVPLFFKRRSLISLIGIGIILSVTTLITFSNKKQEVSSSFFNASTPTVDFAEPKSESNLQSKFYDGTDDKNLEEKELSEAPIKQNTKPSRQKQGSRKKSRVAKNKERYSQESKIRGNNRKWKIREKSDGNDLLQKDLEEVLRGAFLLQ